MVCSLLHRTTSPCSVTFQPNRVAKSASKSEADSDEEVDRDLFDRLYRSAEKIQAKRDKLKEELGLPSFMREANELLKQ